MSETRNNESSSRTGTDYKLSVSSNPGSRRSSIASVNGTDNFSTGGNNGTVFDMDGDQNVLKEYLVPQIRELTDSIVTLDSNMIRLNNIHDNLVDFNESFGSLLYGILCTSACTDFPGVPSDIERELRGIKRLQTLKQERLQLEKELFSLRSRNANTTDKRTSSSKFSEPLFPARGTITNNIPRRRSTNRNDNEISKENMYDDNNSEESFVLNPPIQRSSTLTNSQRQATTRRSVSTNDASKQSSKLRRRSILHTIRNSLLDDGRGNTRLNDGTATREFGNSRTGRPSVVGAPIRNVSRPITRDTARRGTYSASTSRTDPSNRVNKTRTTTKPKSIKDRPPFR